MGKSPSFVKTPSRVGFFGVVPGLCDFLRGYYGFHQ